jgi:AcrR family transcriptional regulator
LWHHVNVPKAANPKVRAALIEAAAEMVARRETPTIRRLAAKVGTSTMAVYTHFGSIDDLLRAVRAEGFARLAARMGAVGRTRDPVADLSTLGAAYVINALENPNLYRVMFLEAPLDADDAAVGDATFEPVIASVERCIAAGRFATQDAHSTAIQLWTMLHGMVATVLAELCTVDDLERELPAMAEALFVGYGDTRRRARASITRAREGALPDFRTATA